MRISIILNQDYMIQNWQLKALSEVKEWQSRITNIIICHNLPKKRKKVSSVFFYLMLFLAQKKSRNLAKIRFPMEKIKKAKIFHFDADPNSLWQEIPSTILSSLEDTDVIIRFGMDLIRISEENLPQFGIISYHHGDSRRYRGRPPAFHEMRNGERVVGVVLQRLSNTIDGGKVLARAFGKVYRYSYGKTISDVYSAGVPLLAKYLDAKPSETNFSESSTDGKTFGLPKNSLVVKFLLKMFIYRMNRIFYGLFFEKNWHIGKIDKLNLNGTNIIHSSQIKKIEPRKTRGSRLADPTGILGDKILCESINMRNYQGSIGLVADDVLSILPLLKGRHYSFPTIVNFENRILLLTESAEHSSPLLFEFNPKMTEVIESHVIKGLENERLIDPSHLYFEGRHFIFGGRRESHQRLDLFWSNEIFGPYEKHPESPICLTPEGSRLAGPIQLLDGSLFRFGQDFSSSYGDGLFAFEVTVISENDYVEKRVGELRFSGVNGPHSLYVYPDKLLIDYYENRFNLFAGTKRIFNKINSVRR